MNVENSKEEETSIASANIQPKDDKGGLPPSTEETSASTRTKEYAKNIKTNRVSFSHMEDSAKDFRHLPKGKRVSRSATVGKADLRRDLCIFVAVMAFFTFVAIKFDDVGKPKTEKDVLASQTTLGRFQKMRKALSVVLEKHMERNPERQDCDLFLAKSTVPASGFGVFAGRNYTIGEDIMILGSPSLAVSTEQSTTLWISPQSLLFKHHPTMANVKLLKPLWSNEQHTTQSADDSPIVVQANKPIMLGEELFLSFEQHLHSRLPGWFDQVIPTIEDYSEADFLIHEARDTFRGPLSSRARNTNKRDQTSVVSLALRMIQSIVSRYRPAAAKLMRVALESLSSYSGKADQVTSLYMGLKNHTVEKLRRQGLCISDVTTGSTSRPTTTKTVVTRNFTKGNRVYPVPLLVRRKVEGRPTQQSCSNDNANNIGGSEGLCQNQVLNACWSRPEAQVEICPLHPFTSMNIVEPGEEDVTVELQWSNWTNAPKVAGLDLSALEEKKNHLEVMLMWDLVAIRDLQKGDEVTLSLERDVATGQWLVPKDLFSKT